jgi:hypothetical protein
MSSAGAPNIKKGFSGFCQNLCHQRHLREINKKNLEISNFLPIFAP